jgi:hypothetical protein
VDLHDDHFPDCGGNCYDANSLAEKCSNIKQGMAAVEENYRSFRPSLEAGGNVTIASEQLSDELAATEVKFHTALIAFLPAALVLIV